MKKEIKKAQNYIFEYRFYRSNIQIVPTSATLTFYSNAGTVIQAATTGTIASDGTITATLLAAKIPAVSVNNKVLVSYVYATVTNEVAELFDVVSQPIVNTVIDNDLFEHIKELRNRIYDTEDTTTGLGTTSTLICKNLSTDSRNLVGGRGELRISATSVFEFEITNFAKSTGTITFTPAAADVVAIGTGFVIRESFKGSIDSAFGDFVVPMLRAKIGIASNIIDSYVVKLLTVYKALQIICFSGVESVDDKWVIRAKFYGAQFADQLSRFNEAWDADEDGNISDDETDNRVQVGAVDLYR